MTFFSKMDETGRISDVRTISQAAMLKCPHVIMMPEHYRPDGSCKCNDAAHRAMMCMEWGYTAADFTEAEE